MKPVFNSLGSNYDFRFVLMAFRFLLFPPSQNKVAQLKRRLEEKYGGRAYAFYKGRDAIEFSLRSLGIGAGDEVITQAFACFAVEEGIVRVGAAPVYADISADSANLSLETIRAVYERHPKVKAVLVQHTFGYPAPIEEIAAWCRQKKVLLLEDLAQAFGATTNGHEVGMFGDAVVFSFGRDKVIDAVSGGACILRANHEVITLGQAVPQGALVRDLLYPLITWMIRAFYSLGVGKLTHWVAKRLGLLASPVVSPTKQMAALPASLAGLVLDRLAVVNKDLEHRRRMAAIYLESLQRFSFVTHTDVKLGANLRFSVLTENPQGLIRFLAKHHVYIADRWYRHAVDSGSLRLSSAYEDETCPRAEMLAQRIVNLPTHRGVTDSDAREIAVLSKKYLETYECSVSDQ